MYSIKDLATITKLSDRTLRNYLSAGILQGEKKNGIWRFTEEQITDFLQDSAVKPSIQAKRNAIFFDFMANKFKKENSACVILDLSKDDATKIMVFICEAVNKRTGMEMSFENEKDIVRVVLSGKESDVYGIMMEYHYL